MSEENKLERKSFLEIVTWGVGGLIGLGLGIPAISYVIGPSLKKTSGDTWIQMGSISKVELGVPTLFKAKVLRQTGWIETEEEISAYLYTENGRDFIAFSNICTHLGCRVRWIEDEGQFFCPCHNAVFDQDGQVVTGPPPKPLDRYQVKLEGDQIYIQEG